MSKKDFFINGLQFIDIISWQGKIKVSRDLSVNTHVHKRAQGLLKNIKNKQHH